MAEAYLKDKRSVITCAAMLNGEYGHKGVYAGVPAILGGNGLEKVLEVELDAGEKRAFETSMEAVQSLVAWVDKKMGG
jgi:malate dehydrogenase